MLSLELEKKRSFSQEPMWAFFGSLILFSRRDCVLFFSLDTSVHETRRSDDGDSRAAESHELQKYGRVAE